MPKRLHPTALVTNKTISNSLTSGVNAHSPFVCECIIATLLHVMHLLIPLAAAAQVRLMIPALQVETVKQSHETVV